MRFYGEVGFSIGSKETAPGVWTNEIVARNYYGDILKNSRKWNTTDKLNDNLTITNKVSILADEFAFHHYGAMRYVDIHGTKWTVTDIELERPRMTLTLGGVYNGPVGTPQTPV